MSLRRLELLYEKFKGEIDNRIHAFKRVMKDESDKNILKELVFCLLTPQSKAVVCWRAVEKMEETGLFDGELLTVRHIKECLLGVRFMNIKAERVRNVLEWFRKGEIREMLANKDVFSLREDLVKEINGFGYKESSHFLRNVGLGLDLAILDRHILSKLHEFGYIDTCPKSLTKRQYLEIESRFQEFANRLGFLPAELDLLLWASKTGYVFK